MSVNKVIIIGNVGKDPEIKTMQSGNEVANLTIATSEQWKDKVTGERRQKTEWHRVVIYGDALINILRRYVKKGSKLYVEGSLNTRKWQDKQGNDKYSTEIVLQGFNSKIQLLDSPTQGQEAPKELDDEMPF